MLKSDSWFKGIKKYALIFGAGGVAALQMMKWELFNFPDTVRVYLGYFFSIITVVCVFIGGSALVDYIKEGQEILKQINRKSEHEEDDDVIEHYHHNKKIDNLEEK